MASKKEGKVKHCIRSTTLAGHVGLFFVQGLSAKVVMLGVGHFFGSPLWINLSWMAKNASFLSSQELRTAKSLQTSTG